MSATVKPHSDTYELTPAGKALSAKRSGASIGVLALGLLGDVLMRTPVLRALRILFPEAKIVAVVDPIGEAVLRHNPDIDGLIVIDRRKRPIARYLYQKIRLFFRLRSAHFDCLIDLYSSGSSAHTLRFSGARERIGFSHSKASKANYTLPFEHENDPGSLLLNRALLKIVSVFTPEYRRFGCRPVMPLSAQTDRYCSALLETSGYEKCYILNFGSGGHEKILAPSKSFAQAKLLYERYGFVPALIRNPGQEQLQERFIRDWLEPNALPYIALPMLDLEQVAGMMKNAAFVVTPDTGLYHIALAMNVPLLGLFTYTNPKLVEPEEGCFLSCFEPESAPSNPDLPFGCGDLSLEGLTACTERFMQQLQKAPCVR